MESINFKQEKESYQVIQLPTGPVCLGGGIHKAMSEIIKDVPAVGKDGHNEKQGYNFRKIDDFMDAMHSVMSKHQVGIRQLNVEVLKDDMVQYNQTPPKYKGQSSLLVTYMFQHADGSFQTAQSIGFGEDYGDKATNKALSASFKYLIMTTFVVPLKEMTEGDLDSLPPASTNITVNDSKTIEEYTTWIADCDNAKALTDVFVRILAEKNAALQKAVSSVLTARAKDLNCGYSEKAKRFIQK